MPHDDHRVEGKGEPAALYSVCAKQIKTVRKQLIVLVGAVSYLQIFAFRVESWNVIPTKTRDEYVYINYIHA
jgi:hypothetical protein